MPTMITALLLLMTTAVTFCSALKGLSPDIHLYGTKLKEGNGTILHFNCSTSHKTLGCSVEFYVNDVTYDSLRFFDDKCVNYNGRCLSNLCCCTQNCMIFTLNMSTKSYNSTFGCEARIFVIDTKTTYSVRTAVTQNGEDFRLFEKVIIPVNVGETSASLTPKPNTDKFKDTKIIVSVVLICLAVCIIGFMVVVVATKRINKPFEETKLTQENDDTSTYIQHFDDYNITKRRSTSEDRLTARAKDQGRPDSSISIISSSSTERSTSPHTRDESSM